MPPKNILDLLAESMQVTQVLDGDQSCQIRKTWFEGSHGRSVTQSLVIKDALGNVYTVSATRHSEKTGEAAWNAARPA